MHKAKIKVIKRAATELGPPFFDCAVMRVQCRCMCSAVVCAVNWYVQCIVVCSTYVCSAVVCIVQRCEHCIIVCSDVCSVQRCVQWIGVCSACVCTVH